MTTVTVNASRQYDIHIGSGVLSLLPEELHRLGKIQKVCIVSDSNVFPLYGKLCKTLLDQAGFSTFPFVFPAGEASKNAATYLELLNLLASRQLTRTDAIVALGGGVVGDLAGFAAATYLRGIRFVQIPTTLLAAVDSSVGGKTAIDLPAGKNLVGAFYQPSLVLCDTDTLNTLPEDTFIDGCAEIIKYAVLYDPDLFFNLEKKGLDFDRESVIRRCVELKRNAVMEDEFDTGARMKLNLGHTVGHGVEAKSNYAISHGKAVAIGMAILSRAAGCRDCGRILSLLQKFRLPVETSYDAQALYEHALSDKKRTGGTVNLIVPRAIGDCAIVPTPVENLQSLIEAGL
ncbi:MAG: 3-dehydroquinate synthase [Oscillospiraceae bacterium]|nr:3-dehydroquinate synthase [Oscillospiraceae bacterium]